MPAARPTLVLVGLAGLVLAAVASPAVAATGSLPLPRPLDEVPALTDVGLTRDRLLVSRAPGPVANAEAVTVAVAADGTPAVVTVEQRLSITGTGDYSIRERGPARRVERIGDTVPPVLKLGTVIWQGFSPGRRDLAARLTLDAGLEAARLPMAVRLGFTGRDGRRTSLPVGAGVPAPGVVDVTLSNATGIPVTLPVGTADPRAAASALQVLLDAARRPPAGRPPTAGNGLPLAVPGIASGAEAVTAVAALRVTGSIRVPGTAARVSGPATTALSDGARIQGNLVADATFQVDVTQPGRLDLDLTVQPWVDPRPLVPPAPFRTWPAWAAAGPGLAAQQVATRTLLTATANAARAAEFTPYLDANLKGERSTAYRYVVAPPALLGPAATLLRPRPAAISAAAVAGLLIAVNLGLLWRRL